MKTQVCHCVQCKHGRRGPYAKEVKAKVSRGRSQVRQLLRRGEYERLPQIVLTGYTD